MKKYNLFSFMGTAIVCMCSGIVPSKASLLQLSHDPLFLNQTVPPAIAVTLDDSGSMAWGYMFRGSFTDWNQFADPTFNRIYYNPNITYTPPIKADGSQMPNIDYTNAPVNGYHAYGHGKWFSRNLTNNFRPLYTTSYYSNNTIGGSWAGWISAATNGGQGTRAFYLRRNTNGTYTEVQLTSAADLTNFANWYSYYSTRMKLARASISRAFAGFGPSFKIDWQNLWDDTNLNDLSKFENTHRSDFYEWLFKSPTSGGTPLRNAFKRAGRLFEDSDSYDSDDFNTKLSCQQNFHIAVSDGEWNGGFSNPAGFDYDNKSLTNLPGDTGTTAEPGAKYGAYNGSGDQTIYPYSGDSNSLADVAFHYWVNDLVPSLNNNVKRFKKDFTDASGVGITVPNGGDEWDVPEFVWNPKNNPAYWQHVVTYNVGMGLESSLVLDQIYGGAACVTNSISDPKEAVYQALRDGSCSWPSGKVDDVWHASINSRGDFFSANDPEELIEALNDVVNDILERLSRGSTSSVSSGVITNDTLAFSPGFDSSTWSGNLLAREVNSDGSFGNIKWDAACVLTGGLCNATGSNVNAQSVRNIYTYDSVNKTRVKFDTSLTANLKTQLSTNSADLRSRTGVNVDDLIEYVSGDRSKEIANGGTLRNRTSVLSDIVHGSPVVVRGPSENYDDIYWPGSSIEKIEAGNGNGYEEYQLAQINRHNMLYIGSNSGMLHAFDADDPTTTEEYWSYIPSKAFDNIHRLADPQFEHWSYVDNTPVVTDAFLNKQWRSVLVGGMRYGGQAYYAIDVTTAQTNSPDVMWEFSDLNDPDMGYTYGKATIARISSTGDWVALLPNGYNNSAKDYDDASDPRNRRSSTGNAVLFVVRLSDGQLLAKLDTGVGSTTTPNGLSSAIAVDSKYSIPPDESEPMIDLGADFAYAGDIYGNLWRFDFSSPNYSDWSSDIVRVIKADNNMHRPITVQPRVINLPVGEQNASDDVMVMFGTGKYIELPDRSINLPADQYMVGVADGLASPYSNLSLTDNKFVEQQFVTSGRLRTLSANTVDLNNDYGWKVKLSEQGERLANPLTLLGKKLLLASSTVTAGIDPCEGGGRSWLLAFDPITGGTPEVGNIFEDIIVTDVNGNPITTVTKGTGILINDLIVGQPPILETPGAYQIIVEGSENTEIITLQSYTWRRRNWTNLLTE